MDIRRPRFHIWNKSQADGKKSTLLHGHRKRNTIPSSLFFLCSITSHTHLLNVLEGTLSWRKGAVHFWREHTSRVPPGAPDLSNGDHLRVGSGEGALMKYSRGATQEQGARAVHQ